MTVVDDLSTLLPSAKAMMEKIGVGRGGEGVRRDAQERARRGGEEQVMKKAAAIIERAAKNGLSEVQVYRFPNALCTDRGRAINQQEPGWENTLTGIPKEIYEFWHRQLRPLDTRCASKLLILRAAFGATLACR